jgi:hypothetical protein
MHNAAVIAAETRPERPITTRLSSGSGSGRTGPAGQPVQSGHAVRTRPRHAVDKQEAFFWYRSPQGRATQTPQSARKPSSGRVRRRLAGLRRACPPGARLWPDMPMSLRSLTRLEDQPVAAASPHLIMDTDAAAPMMMSAGTGGRQARGAGPATSDALGFNVGTPDGKMGSRTLAMPSACSSFSRA